MAKHPEKTIIRPPGQGYDIPETDAYIAEMQKENDTMRTVLAHADLPCLYCGLSFSDMAKCEIGFPGCGRADDMMVGILPEKYKFLEDNK